jgi:protein phosphatase
MELAWGSTTHPGRVRSRNEDSLLATQRLFVVADGMGGHAAVNEASRLAVEAIAEQLPHGPWHDADVLEAIRQADQTIGDLATGDRAGMGTTLVGLAVTQSSRSGDQFLVFNVGDSRCYRLRDGAIVQLSHDHSVVQELVDRGLIGAAEAETHPQRNVVTRSLGRGLELEVDWFTAEPETGDRYLVCSDGLTRELTDGEIASILGRADDPQVIADALVADAVERGARDNVSVVVVHVDRGAP